MWPDPQTAKTVAGYISLFTDFFLRLIKMIIAPLVFTTLVVGVAHMGDTKAVGRIVNLPLPDAGASTNLNAASLSLKDFVTHLVPKSAVEAMANNEILQIVVFSLFFGVAAASLGDVQPAAAMAARDVSSGESWAFDDHRTMAQVMAEEAA